MFRRCRSSFHLAERAKQQVKNQEVRSFELYCKPMRLTSQERQLLQFLGTRSDVPVIASQFRGARKSMSAYRLARRFGGIRFFWAKGELPSFLCVRLITPETWSKIEDSNTARARLWQTCVAAGPLFILQMAAGFAFQAVSGLPVMSVPTWWEMAWNLSVAVTQPALGFLVFNRLFTRVVYILDDVTSAPDERSSNEARQYLHRTVLPKISSWSKHFQTVVISSNEALSHCFRDAAPMLLQEVTLDPATEDEFVATLHRLAAKGQIPNSRGIDKVFVGNMCAVHGIWHGLSVRFWKLLPREAFDRKPTCAFSRGVLLRIALELDLEADKAFRIMALCGSPLVRIDKFTKVAAMIVTAEGADAEGADAVAAGAVLVKAAEALVGVEVPRRMLLATLFVADLARRGYVDAATEEVLVLEMNNQLKCHDWNTSREENMFNRYIAPLRRALQRSSAQLPTTAVGSGVWAKITGEGALEVALKVVPEENTVFALKEAVKAKMESQERGLIVNAFKMQVLNHDGTACDKMSAPVDANTEETAYKIVLPKDGEPETPTATATHKDKAL